MIISVEDLIDTSNMKMTDEEIYQSLVRLGYIEEEDEQCSKNTERFGERLF